MSSYGYVLPTSTIYEDESGYECEGKDAEDDRPEVYVELSAVEGKGSTDSELSRNDWSSRPLPDIPTPEHARSTTSRCRLAFKSVSRVVYIVIVTFSVVCVVVANYHMFFVLPRVPSEVTTSVSSTSSTDNNSKAKTSWVTPNTTESLPTSLVTFPNSPTASNSSSTSIETSAPSKSSEPSPTPPETTTTIVNRSTSVETSASSNSTKILPTPPAVVPSPNSPEKSEPQFITVTEIIISLTSTTHAFTNITNLANSTPSTSSEVRPTPSIVVPSSPPPKKAT